ncbi:MAG: alpha/beta fold hydrolase [Gammaproteobacteria bacterium]|nr:alpha/beta fold hydrolase [Gammaproteobacteria bacterium]
MIKLNSISFGEQHSTTPLIVLHGLLGSASNWRLLAKQWGEYRPVHALDLRNHGQSPHTDSMSYHEMADDIRWFMDEHKIERTHLLGHSMGGKVAMQFAMDFATRLDHLIIADIAPKQYPRSHDAVFAALQRIAAMNILSRQQADDAIRDLIPDLSTRQFLLTNLVRTEQDDYRWRVNVTVIQNSYEQNILAVPDFAAKQTFTGATLFIGGGDSPYIQTNDHALIKRYFPQAEITMIPNAGHWLHVDQTALFDQQVRDFLADH